MRMTTGQVWQIQQRDEGSRPSSTLGRTVSAGWNLRTHKKPTRPWRPHTARSAADAVVESLHTLTLGAAGRRRALQKDTSCQGMSSTGHPETRTESAIPCWDEERQGVVHLSPAAASALMRPLFPNDAAQTRVVFPLSADHLITLVQLNVMRACMTNIHLFTGSFGPAYDCTGGTLQVAPESRNVDEMPPSLAPTTLQSTVPHDQWIDSFPHPTWRDNFIRAAGTFDEDELCSDLVGALFEGGTTADSLARGVIVWSPTWNPAGWELSEGFVRKWGWTIKGCDEVLEATNRWRRLRGESDLVIEVE